MNQHKKIVAALFVLLGLLGITLGLSVTSFLILLNLDPARFNDYKIFSIITYFSTILFVITLIITLFVYVRNADVIKNKFASKGENNEKEEL